MKPLLRITCLVTLCSALPAWACTPEEATQKREELAGLIVIMDVRRPLLELDETMLDWFATTGKPIHILLTKSDKLSRQQSTVTLMKVKAYLAENYPQCSVQLFSSLKKQGVEQAEAVIAGWLKADDDSGEPVVEEGVID